MKITNPSRQVCRPKTTSKTSINKTIVEGSADGLYYGETPQTDPALLEKICEIVDCLPAIKDLLTQIASQPQLEGIALIKYCDAQGNVTGYAGTILDEETNTTTTLYFDALLQATTTPPAGVPCPEKDIELKTMGPIEKCDNTGSKYYGFYCKLFVNGIEQSETQFWILPDGTTTATMPIGITDCVSDEVIGSGFGCIISQGGQTVTIDDVTNDSLYADVTINGNGDYILTFATSNNGPIAQALIGLGSGATGYGSWTLIADAAGFSDFITNIESGGLATIATVGSNYVLTVPAASVDGSTTVGVQGYTFIQLDLKGPATYTTTGETHTQVQWIKFQSTDGTFYDRFYTLSESGKPLVEFAFDPATQIFSEDCEIKYPEIREKEVCATIDGDPQKYELIKIYTRNEQTGVITVLHYEDTFGNIITGTVTETCCDCTAICYGSTIAPIANRRSDSYGAFTAQYKTWLDDGQYDSLYMGRGPVGSPRNHYYRVKVYDASNTLVSNSVLGPYAVDPTNATYLQFLSDASALTASIGVAIVGPSPSTTRGGYQIEYNDATGFSIILEHGIDNHSGGVIRNPDIKQAIRYEPTRGVVRDSVALSGDLNNPAADAGGREWTNMRGVFNNSNIVTI